MLSTLLERVNSKTGTLTLPASATPAIAPKARPIPAWGEAPCKPASRTKGLKVRPNEPSIPHILLIKLHAILFQTAPAALRKSLSLHARAASLLLALVPILAAAQAPQSTSHQQLRIRILNAKTNKPITDEKLNVALRVDQIGSVAMPTDKYGIVTVDIGSATIIRILSNMYADCRPRAELYTNYPIADILHTGVTTGNLCSALTHRPTPGELLLFEIPRTSVPVSPQPPATNLPHSDEYPQ